MSSVNDKSIHDKYKLGGCNTFCAGSKELPKLGIRVSYLLTITKKSHRLPTETGPENCDICHFTKICFVLFVITVPPLLRVRSLLKPPREEMKRLALISFPHKLNTCNIRKSNRDSLLIFFSAQRYPSSPPKSGRTCSVAGSSLAGPIHEEGKSAPVQDNYAMGCLESIASCSRMRE